MLYRKVTLLAIEMVRLVGSVGSLRPYIALVFTHLLSSTTCIKHGIPYTILSKVKNLVFSKTLSKFLFEKDIFQYIRNW